MNTNDLDEQGRRRVTVDTGHHGDVFPGALLTWLHIPRGGYGYVLAVDAKVLRHSRRPSTKVRIEVTTRDGEKVARTVDAANLRWRGR